MKPVIFFIAFFCAIGIVYSQKQIPNVGYVKCVHGPRGNINLMAKCKRALQGVKDSPFKILNYNDLFSLRFSYYGSCEDGIKYIQTIPGCETCNEVQKPLDTIPLCQPANELKGLPIY